jgi:hypothetical protein
VGQIEMAVIRREVSDRTTFGKIVKWIFILWNLFMVFALVKGCAAATSAVNAAPRGSAEQAGAAIGTALGTGMLMMLWLMGDIIIGTFVLFTRRKKIIEIEE